MGYVRGGNKDHGRQNRIEGKLEKGQKVVVVEDLISTGGSVIDVVEALREAGAEVLGIASIFTYGMQKGLDRLAAAGVKNVQPVQLRRAGTGGGGEGLYPSGTGGAAHSFPQQPQRRELDAQLRRYTHAQTSA